MRGFQTQPTAQVVCSGHGLVRNLAGGHYYLGVVDRAVTSLRLPLLMRAWNELTELLLAG